MIGKRSLSALLRKAPLFLGIVIALGLSAFARADDLLSVYKLAAENDPRFRAAEANYKAIQERLPQARAGLLPTLSATGAKNRNEERVETDQAIFTRPAGEAGYRSGEYRFSLSQPIYNGVAWATLRQTNAEVRRAEAEFLAARQDLILRVAQAYFEILLAQDAVALAKAEKEALSRNLESIENRRKAGLANITEANDARARYQIAVAQEIEAANKLDDAREALREIIGQTPEALAGIGDNAVTLVPEPADINKWVEAALSSNLVLQAAKEAVEAARENIARNRAAHYPTLEAVGNRSRTDTDGSIPGPGIRTDNSTIGLQVTVPLFQGGLVNARVAEATQRYNATQQELEGQRRAVERVARSAFQGVTGGAARIDALRHAITSAESALTAKTEGRAIGLYTTLDILDATRDLFRAKRDYSEARHLHLLSFLRLKNAAGTLSEDDVAALNQWMN